MPEPTCRRDGVGSVAMTEINARNEISEGRFEAPVVQAGNVAGGIHISSPGRVVKSAVNSTRGFGVLGFLYRAVASLAGCTALLSFRAGTPLAVLGRWFEWLGLPTGWVVPTGDWIAVREHGLGEVATLFLLVGLLCLPGPGRLGRDLDDALWWRSPSTVVLAGAIAVQCGAGLWGFAVELAVVGAIVWTVGRMRGRSDEHRDAALAGLMALALAVGFLPLFLLVAIAGRDRRRDG
jgi:hypothetical protein